MTKTEAKQKLQAGEIQIYYNLQNVQLLNEVLGKKDHTGIFNYYTPSYSSMHKIKGLPIIKISEITEEPNNIEVISEEVLNTPAHYDNSKGTLYKIGSERNWNPYLFDIVKRLERAEKKGEFVTDLEKSINVIKLWLKESETK